MAGYRRFIAYVYDYENGKKGSNCGFIKVEVKDQQCSVEVHLHCQGLPEDIGCKVYGFTRKVWINQWNSAGQLRNRKRSCGMSDHHRCNEYEFVRRFDWQNGRNDHRHRYRRFLWH